MKCLVNPKAISLTASIRNSRASYATMLPYCEEHSQRMSAIVKSALKSTFANKCLGFTFLSLRPIHYTIICYIVSFTNLPGFEKNGEYGGTYNM